MPPALLRLFTWLWRLVFAAFLVLALACLAITIYGITDNCEVADLAVIPGNKVEPDGTPSPMLQARLDQAVTLYQRGFFKLVLVSGAHGVEGYDETAVMRHYLESAGIPHEAIFEDNTGFSTWDTARDTSVFLKQQHLHSVLLITQYFHMARCRLAFTKFGIRPIYTSHAPYWSIRDLYSLPREAVALVSYEFRHP